MPEFQTLALLAITLMAAGYLLLGALQIFAAFRPVTSETWAALVSATISGGAVLAALWVGGALLAVALLALVWRCGYEAALVARPALPPVAFGGALAIAAGLAALAPLWLVAGSVLCLFFLALFLRNTNNFRGNPHLDLALFPGLPLVLFAAAGMQEPMRVWLLAAFILVETFDSYALLGGKLFGRRPAFPVLSPRKTVEGLATGALMLMLTAALAAWALGLPVAAAALLALFSGALAVAGDLAASALKRRGGVKDFATVLPRQGGLLDIADAWIAAGAGLAALLGLTGAL